MDKSTFRHRLAVSWWDDSTFDVFVRSDDGSVEHYWSNDDLTIFGPEDLGGSFDTDPVVVGNHLVGRSGRQLVDWVWNSAEQPGMLGVPRVVLTLPGLCATTPDVLATPGQIHVFAPSLDGPMQHWFLDTSDEEWHGPEVLTDTRADIFTQPCAVRSGGGIEVFGLDGDNRGLLRWFNLGDRWRCERLTRGPEGEGLTGRPAAVWSADERADVFAVRSDGVPVHWGFDGSIWRPDEVRLGDPGLRVPGDLMLISVRPKQLTLVARQSSGEGVSELVGWNLDPTPPGGWRPQGFDSSRLPTTLTASDSSVQLPPDGRVELRGRMKMLTRDTDGSFARRLLTLTNEHSIDGFALWELDDDVSLAVEEPLAPPSTFTPVVVEPAMLARRPDDLVLMGVRWNDAVEVVAGSLGELVAHAGAELAVTIPPQHYAEEVVPAEGGGEPTLDAGTGGVPVWGSSPSGPSRIVVTLGEGTRVPLTVAGVLDALRTGRLARLPT